MTLESTPHKIGPNYALTRVITSKIGTVYFYNSNIVVVEINEGVDLSYIVGGALLVRCLLYLRARPWVYISHRRNQYSVLPTDYTYLHKIPTLKALSIVRSADKKYEPAPIETIFCKKPFELFHDLDEALAWGNSILNS